MRVAEGVGWGGGEGGRQIYIFGNDRCQPELFRGLPRADPVISIGCVNTTMLAIADSGSLFRSASPRESASFVLPLESPFSTPAEVGKGELAR